MKTLNQIILTAASATALTSAAMSGVTTYSNLGSWTSAATAISSPGYFVGSGITGDPTPLAFSVTGSGTSGTISGGGFYYAGASVSATGTGTFTSSGSNIVYTAGANTSTLVFTLNANVWAFALQYSATTAGPSELFLQGFNNQPPLGQSEVTVAGGGAGWMGVVNNAGTANQVVLTLNGGDSITLVGAQYYMVPSPGAAALAGVAGLVGIGRRRRA